MAPVGATLVVALQYGAITGRGNPRGCPTIRGHNGQRQPSWLPYNTGPQRAEATLVVALQYGAITGRGNPRGCPTIRGHNRQRLFHK